MSNTDMDRTVTLELELAEAIVLDKWLRQMDEPDTPTDMPPFQQAVLRVRWNLVALLETVSFPGEFGNGPVDYDEAVEAAIQSLQVVELDESE